MKLMKIFGMVFALHVALACVLVLIQGCRSTPTRAADPTPTTASTATEPGNWSSQSSSSTLAPTPVDSTYASTTPISNAPLSGLTPAERLRTEPTRPANPGAYISTDTPTALSSMPSEPVMYVVRAGDSLWKIAKANGTTTAAIQKLNPTLKADALRPGMSIKLPGTATSFAPASPVNFGPGVTSTASSATYIVRSGDSLSKVAARNGTTVAALREANNLRSDVLQVGQALQIPGGASEASVSFSPDLSGPAPGGSPTSTVAGDRAGRVTVVVQRGDTLGAIARKFAVTVRDLMAENNISDPTKVRVGQQLVIPGFQAVGTGAVPSRPSTTVRPPPNTATLPPPVTNPPPAVAPPVNERPPEFDAPGSGVDAPPVQAIEGEPMPAP